MKMRSVLTLVLFCTALTPAAAQAEDQQNQNACMSDAMTVCAQFIPDRQRVAGLSHLQPQPHLGTVSRAAGALAWLIDSPSLKA